jgi:truncated hemoglobin YjbI
VQCFYIPHVRDASGVGEVSEKERNMQPQVKSLYEELGGDKLMDAAISKFFDQVVSDSLLALYFTHVDVTKVRSGFRNYIAASLGGETAYHGHSLRQAHKGTQITDLAFDSFVDLFLSTLKGMGVRDDLLSEVRNKLTPLKNDVVDSFDWTGKHYYAPNERR